MAHRLAPEAAADLEDLWLYVANNSGSTEAADGLIDALTARFLLLASFPMPDAGAIMTYAWVCVAFPSGST